MTQILEVISKIGIFIILAAKSFFQHIMECLSSCIGIFWKVNKLKNPENNFRDFNQFVKLVTEDDESDDEPGLLTDEQVERMVNESMSKDRNKKKPKNNDFYEEDEEEDNKLKDEESGNTSYDEDEDPGNASDILKKLKKETREKLMKEKGLTPNQPKKIEKSEPKTSTTETDILGGSSEAMNPLNEEEDENLLI